MVSFKQAILPALTAGLAAHAQAQPDILAETHELAVRANEQLQFQGYSAADEKMPVKCTR